MGIQLLASIVVLCYNGLQVTTIPCLQSIVRNTPAKDFELIIVDNASTDGTADYLKQFAAQHNNVRLQLNDTNRGYAGGNNDGIRLSSGKFIVLLNNDTLVSADWLTKLLRVLESKPSLGIVGPVTNSAGNEQRIELKSLNEKNFEKIAKDYTDRQRNVWFETEKLGFFCMAMRREVFEKIGYLDEKFGIGMFEDDDYCVRAKQAGFGLAVVEDCFIFHKGSASFNQLATEEYQKIFDINRAYFREKHNSVWSLSDIAFAYISKFQIDLVEYRSKTKESPPEIERILVRLENYKHLLVQISGVEISHQSSGRSRSSYHPMSNESKWAIRKQIFLRNVVRGTRAEKLKYFRAVFDAVLRVKQERINTVMPSAIQSAFDEIHRQSTDRKVIIFPATVDFNYMTQRPQQLARAFAKLGYMVIYGTLNHQVDKVEVSEEVEENLYVLNEKYFKYLAYILNKEKTIYYCMWPNNIKHLDYLPYNILLYDYMDDISLLDLPLQELRHSHNEMLRNSNLITVSADRLMEQIPKELVSKAVLINNAVSQEFIDAVKVYAKTPNTAQNVSDMKVLGYYGAIAEWFDFDLIEYLAAEIKNAKVVLIGPIDEKVASRVSRMLWRYTNIRILPTCKQLDLIPMLMKFDVCMIPFIKNSITDAVSPVKLFEYLSARKPIVSTNIAECAKYDFVYIANNHVEFSDHINKIISQTYEFNKNSCFSPELNTWTDRAKAIIERCDI